MGENSTVSFETIFNYKKNASCTLIALVNYQFCLNQREYEINERIS